MMIGTLLNRRYRLDAELGRGGMGRVYRAHDTLLERDVALKVLSDRTLGTAGRARLLREAQAVAQLNHSNIVSVYDAGETDRNPFIVMELVNGQSLHERPPQSLDEILSIARQICAALEHAHAHSVVHRDLKPENVLITSDGSAKLMDFGLARAGDSRLTLDGGIVGTVFYLAPEQALGQPVDGRADLYALGVMLYELTTGRLPFTGDDPLGVISQHIHAPVTPPRSVRPDLSPALEAIMLKLLAKNPADRFASAREVAVALAALKETHPLQPAMPSRHNLPIQLTSFIGREKEIAEIKRLLAFADRRLLTITGSGGTGKTRLALQVAADLLAAFEDGVWLIELASLSDPQLVPHTVANVLGVREDPSYPLTKALADYLRPKSLLLILDNCEHLINACAQLTEALLRACPNVKIIASSREALGVPGETTFRVPSLSLPDIRQIGRLPPAEVLMQYESIRLFLDRAIAVKPDFRLTDANAAAVAQICHRLDGVPLAIELAAARVRTMTAEQIASRLDDRFRLLTGGSRTALPRQQTLRALIDWSWELLSNAERALLRRLSVFLDGWTLEAAEAVVPDLVGDGVDEGDVLELLTHLEEKSLVIVEERGADMRYYLLETIRQYARDKLLEAGVDEAANVRSRHLGYFVLLSDQAEPKLRSAEQLGWLAQLETEHDNLRAALKWALGNNEIEDGLRLAGNLSRFWYLRGYWNEGREWLSQMLSQSPGPGEADLSEPLAEPLARARVKALCGAGWLADDNGGEIALYTESLALCRQIGDKWGEAYSLRGMVASEANWGNWEHVQAHLHESLHLFRELQDTWGIALVLYNLGWLTLDQAENNEKAEATWQDSLQRFRQSGDRWGIAVTLNALGYVARIQGDYGRATALTEESLTLFRELGDKAGIATSLTRLGNVAGRRGDYLEASALLEKGIALRRERGDQEGVINALCLLGIVAGYQGDYPRATAVLEESLALAQESGEQLLTVYARMYLAWVSYIQNDIEGAAAVWQECLTQQRERDNREGVAYSLLSLGLIALRQGNDVRAAEYLEESLRLYQAIGDKRYIAAAHQGLGALAHAHGDDANALLHMRESLLLRKRMGDKQGIVESLEGLASTIAMSETAVQPAVRLFAAARGLREAIGAPVPPVERADQEQFLATTRAQIGEAAFADAWAEGNAMTMEQAIALAQAKEASIF